MKNINNKKYQYRCIGCGKIINTDNEYPYGWICLNCRNTTKLPLKCSICNNTFTVTWNTYRIKDKSIPWRCRSCNDKYRNELYNKKPDDVKKAFIERQRKRSKEYWKNLSKEDKIKDSSRKKKLWKKRFENGEAINILNSMKHGRSKWWNSLSEEEKKYQWDILNKGRKLWFENMSPEEIEKWKLKISEYSKSQWSSLSKEERMERMRGIHEGCIKFWREMTTEKYQDWQVKQMKGYKEYLKKIDPLDINTEPNKNEKDFINELNLYNINYIFQCPNITIHPDFNKLFPFNPVTKADFVNPLHMWDFMIYTNTKDIFVDIDGSIHYKDTYTKTHPYTNVVYKELDYKKFNDSKRPYQTDGLDAYVIQCYDDNLNDNTPVLNINTNKKILFKEFISIINWYNMTNEEQRKIIKIAYNIK